MNAGAPVGDMAPALFCALGIVSAVLRARETGRGQLVDVAMYDAVLAICERIVYLYSYTGQVAIPQGAGNPQLCPFDAFPTKDGWISIAAPGERHWQYLCDVMGNPELGTDPELASNQQRVERAEEVRRAVGDWTSQYSTREVEELLGGLVPCGPVHTAADIFADPHVARRQMLSRVEHPGMSDLATLVNSPIRMSESSVGVRRRAPLLGEHTDEVFSAMGITAAEIAELRAQQAIA
jgi:crotonobetainyl-CoA:carnitine CoA-transferase CaiB-like acyl-CoA transferase